MFARWHEQANTLQQALKLRFEPSYETFVKFFNKKKYQGEVEGFDFGAWTGSEEERGSVVTLCCGVETPLFPNNCLLRLPSKAPEASRVLAPTVLVELLRAMALAWEPEWGLISSWSMWERLSQNHSRETFVGWLTYLSHHRGRLPPLPEPVRVEPVAELGSIIILSPEHLSSSSPEHMALAERVQSLLDGAGLLGPLKPWHELTAGKDS
jgi:hypothetical protein